MVYVCWDVLYVGDTSVVARPLSERHALLRAAIRDAPDAGVPIGEHAPCPPSGQVFGCTAWAFHHLARALRHCLRVCWTLAYPQPGTCP